ncbi:VWA domain-containing protein [Saccharopolyspora spinosa]|uniref:VWA domain containing CoxE-like protein n=1 Tax=Saccharopolyspora spinosa TaxID=60894 RepID=A0A2N3Y7B7_SACSN|nr:VWA domain-containing protein [Saccharopolyspora spinosa]PKW18771.1 VWA domain containing CoxE-like protein [Saccharopolyspora spinosa]
MSTHLVTDTAVDKTRLDSSRDAVWLRLSATLTDEVPVIADREDLLVTIAPGAGHGAPACYFPHHATIEIDGTHLGTVDPATMTPDRLGDRARYATAWGLLTHECAHARHSVWEPPHDAPPGAVDAAMLLEESRIEANQIRRRPDDRHWLRACATHLILADTHANDPTRAPSMTPHAAAHAAALLLARTDAGILTPDETKIVGNVVDSLLGTSTLDELRDVWLAAHHVDDGDADTMIDLGRRWCEALGTDPDRPSPTAGAGGKEATPGETGPPSPLASAIAVAAARTAVAVATEDAPADPATAEADAANAERQAQQDAAKAARKVFSAIGGPRTGKTTITGTRPPTGQERAAARRLGRALSTAGIRDRVATKTTSPTPPGRLRMRGALAADAQRAAGALPTAEPFTRTTRRIAPSPPLRLGIACDVSGSMSAFAGPVASAAWILNHAAHHAEIPAAAATVIFGNRVRAITRPDSAPAHVTEFDADDNYEDIPRAIDALDGALDLYRPAAARLLVIVSDGRYRHDPRREGQRRVDRLRANGCAVLWLAPDSPRVEPLHGVTVHPLADPTATAHAIGHAATAALRAAR